MAISKPVRKWTRIVPLQFARAPDAANANTKSGTFDSDAPEPDARGYKWRNERCAVLPIGLDEAQAEAARPETRVKLTRRDMAEAGRLFLTLSKNDIIQLTSPQEGQVLPADKNMLIKFKALKAGEVFLEVRFFAVVGPPPPTLGSNDGPVIHRLKIKVNAIRDVKIKAHVPQIRGTAQNDTGGNIIPDRSVRTDAQIQAMITAASKLYLPYGIRFVLDGAVDRAGTLNFANQGMANDLTNEFNLTTAHNRAAGAVNMYFVPQIGGVADIDQVGGSASSSVRNPGTFGSLIADMASAAGQTLAHELGHVLNLVNDPNPKGFIHVNTKEDPAIPGTGRDVRFDIVSRRRLMWAYTNFLPDATMPYRFDVGYGNNQPGGMLAIRNLTQDPTDLEMAEVQNAAAALRRAAGP